MSDKFQRCGRLMGKMTVGLDCSETLEAEIRIMITLQMQQSKLKVTLY